MRGSKAGISDGYQPPPTTRSLIHSSILELIDIIISTSLVAPLVVGYWRGTWELIGYYLLPHKLLVSACISFGIGICGHLIFLISQNYLQRTIDPDRCRLTFYVLSRTYTYIYGFVCVNGWRGAWIMTDIFTGNTMLFVILLVTLSAVLLLALTRGLRNCCATPFALITDYREGYFEVTTMFKTLGSQEPGLYVLDCIFSVLIVGTLVVVAWRGVWVMLDLTLYPNSKPFSAWGSLIIGYGIVAITFALQPIMRWTCDRITGFCRIAVADIFLFLSFIGTVNVWRGVWMLLDVYLLPENHILSCWLTHTVSFIILALLNCSNSVLVRGVYIDAEEPAGECVVFPIHYIRLFFQKERTKKQKRFLDALEKQDQNLLIDKQSLGHNNIKIVKNNNKNLVKQNINVSGAIINDEAKPMLSSNTTTPIIVKSVTSTTNINEKSMTFNGAGDNGVIKD